MMRLFKYLVFSVLCIVATSVFAQEGVVHDKYSPSEYGASPQNWGTVSDSRGLIYIVNTTSILRFNGSTWRSYPNLDNKVMTAINIDKEDNIYVGGQKFIGKLMPKKNGDFELKSIIPDSLLDKFNRIYHIACTPDSGVYFGAYEAVIRLYEGKFTVILPENESFFPIVYTNKGEIYTDDDTLGIVKIKGNKKIPLKVPFITHKDTSLTDVAHYDDRQLLVLFRNYGVFLLDKETSEIRPLSIELNKVLKEIKPYKLFELKNDEFAVITNESGVYVINKYGDIISHYHQKNGLTDDVGINGYLDNNSMLWVNCNNGNSKIYYNFPLTIYGEKHGVDANVYFVDQFDDQLLLGTTFGAGKFENDKLNYFSREGQTWSGGKNPFKDQYMMQVGDMVTFFERGGKRYSDSLVVDYHSMYSNFEEHVIYSFSRNYMLKSEVKNKKLKHLKKYKVNAIIRNAYEVEKGKILFYSEGDEMGIIDIRQEDVKVEKLGKKHGFSSDVVKGYLSHSTNLDKYIVYANDSLYEYSTKEDKVIPMNFDDWGLKKFDIRSIKDGPNGQMVFLHSAFDITYVKLMGNGKALIDTTSFKVLSDMNISEGSLLIDNYNILWVGSNEGFFRFDLSKFWPTTNPYSCNISNVALEGDSSIHRGYFFEKVDSLNYQILSEQPIDQVLKLPYDYNNIHFEYEAIDFYDPKYLKYQYKLEGNDENWSVWTDKTDKEYTNLREGAYIFRVKAINAYGNVSKESIYAFEVLPPIYRTVWAFIIYVVLAVGLVFLVIKINAKRLLKENERLEKVVLERTAEIEQQKEELQMQAENLAEVNETLSQQKEEIQQAADELNITNERLEEINTLIADRNKSITDSINYAKRIQEAMLPSKDKLTRLFDEAFVFVKPKDIVGGDFYWIHEDDQYLYWSVIDCTGHGVPGGFMSMIGNSILNEIVSEQNVKEVDEILNKMREKVIKSVNGGMEPIDDVERKDGMDIALCRLNKMTYELDFAGGNLNAYIFHDGELVEIHGDPQPVGAYKSMDPFNKKSFKAQKGDKIYLFSDGYVDQFGGTNYKKFKYRRMRALLNELNGLGVDDQYNRVKQVFNSWKGEGAQTDDVTLFGVKL